MGGVSSIGQEVGGVGDGRESWRVVDERSGGGDHTAGSIKDGGLSISRPLSIVTVTTITIRVTIISSVSSVSIITIVGISLWLGVSRSLAVVTNVRVSVISNSNSDEVS